MSRVTGSIPSLFNGVSQQTPALRLATQGSEQVNFYPSLVQGLVKRPPLEIINDAMDESFLDAEGTPHVVDRGGDNEGRERCFLFVTKKGITAFRQDGTQKPVQATTEALNYLALNNTSHFSVLTLADYTFISNPTVKVELEDTLSPSGTPCVLGVIKQAAYDTDYSVSFKVGEQEVSAKIHTWASVGTTDSPRDKVSIDNVVEMLKIALLYEEPSGGFNFQYARDIKTEGLTPKTSRPFYVKSEDGVLVFYSLSHDAEITKFKISDSEGGQLTRSIHGKAERFSDLPEKAPDGCIVKITGDDTTRFNDYYLMFNEEEGVWKECPEPDIRVRLNAKTLPHVLIDEGSYFRFEASEDWAERTCGDDDTCPVPDFVGYPITGIFQFRNRLGFLSEDVVALSEASEFFNFWNTTAMTAVDSDPIYLSASVDGAPLLRWAVPFNEEVILFSDRAQFKLASPEVLSPATAAIQTATNYSVNTAIRPLPNGRNIFFADSQAHTVLTNSARVYEYYIDTDTGTKAAMEITSHVPQYLSRDITDMTCSSGLSLLALYAQGKSTLWMYKYYWSGNEKLQAAWFTTDLYSREILGVEFIGDVLYCLVYSHGRYFFCKMDFSITLDDASDPLITQEVTGPKAFPVYLDMRNAYDASTGVYDPWEDVTYLHIPNYYDSDRVVIVNMNTYQPLEPVRWDETTGQLVVRGNATEMSDLVIGETFSSSYTFSPAVVRTQQQNGQITVHQGRLQLQKWRLVLGPTGYLVVKVCHESSLCFTYHAVPIRTSTPRHLLGRMNATELSHFEFPVRGDAKGTKISLINNTWFPSTVISAEWDANYITKGRQNI